MRQKYNSFCLFLAGRRNSRFIGTMRGRRNYNVRLEKWQPSNEQRTEGISNISPYYRYPMILSMTLVTNVIFLFLYTCVAIPFKVITCCFAFFFSLCHPCQVQNPHKVKQMPPLLPLILQTHQTRCHYGLHLLKRHQPIIASYYPALLRREK